MGSPLDVSALINPAANPSGGGMTDEDWRQILELWSRMGQGLDTSRLDTSSLGGGGGAPGTMSPLDTSRLEGFTPSGTGNDVAEAQDRWRQEGLGTKLPGRFSFGTGGLSGLVGEGLRRAGGFLKNNPDKAVGLAGVITALAGAGGGGGGNGQPSADAQRLNAITEQRMRRVDPLHQAVTQLAWSRLPINARQGISPPTYSPLP